jgi:hypothetical protein
MHRYNETNINLDNLDKLFIILPILYEGKHIQVKKYYPFGEVKHEFAKKKSTPNI